MIKTKYKVFSVFLFALVLLSCFAFPASAAAADESINVEYTTAITSAYYADANGVMQSLSRDSFSSVSAGTFAYNVTYTADVSSACDSTTGNSLSNGWIGYWFKITPNTDLTAYNLADYNLSLYWAVKSDFTSSTNPIPSDIYEVSVNDFIASDGYIGITSTEREKVCLPRIGALHTFDTVDIVRDDASYMLSQSLLITDADTVAALTNKGKSVNVMLPAYVQADSHMFQYTFRLILKPKTTQTTDGYDLGTPASYTFNIPMTYGIENEMLLPSISDVYYYGSSGGYRFRDYSKYYTHYSLPFQRDKFAMWSVLARKSDLSDASAWQNSVLDQLKLNIPYSLSIPENFDLDAQKVEFLFRIRIAGPDVQLNWYPLNELAGTLRRKFYDFEPYALQVGGLTMGYNYFESFYYDEQKTVELICRLSSEDETQKMFIKALLENTSFNLTFSVDPDMHGALVALPYAGFFLGDAVPSPDSPRTPCCFLCFLYALLFSLRSPALSTFSCSLYALLLSLRSPALSTLSCSLYVLLLSLRSPALSDALLLSLRSPALSDALLLSLMLSCSYMDDEICAELHERLAPCTDQEFFTAYEKAHEEKFGEEWELSKANPCW